jgi:hypothetical protein
MDDVPEEERKETARQVAEKLLPKLRAAVAAREAAATTQPGNDGA